LYLLMMAQSAEIHIEPVNCVFLVNPRFLLS
jgi:hypothetical protein